MKTAVSLPDDLFQAADVTPVALDRRTLVKRVRKLAERKVALVVRGVDIVLGR
ncbi:MAG: hypothetical protein OXC12_14375 [Spirochaetaceae bacterium]|nr:hypothetical protein [Spirochaetaceae bacterium]